VISVSDNGPGISSDLNPSLGNSVTNEKDGRPRLGLWTVREIVHALGGKLTECGVPGQGAEFRLVFPCDESGRCLFTNLSE
jgi:signal transduction histidine kinase